MGLAQITLLLDSAMFTSQTQLPVHKTTQDKIVEGVSITGLGAFQLQWGLVQDSGLNLMADPSEVRLAYDQKEVGCVRLFLLLWLLLLLS